MKITQTYHELEPSTVQGFAVKVETIYATHDQNEYHALIKMLKKHIQSYTISEVLPDEAI